MKSEKELSELKKQYEELSDKFRELTDEELAQVAGGTNGKVVDMAVGVVIGGAFAKIVE